MPGEKPTLAVLSTERSQSRRASTEELIERARALAPFLKERAARAEADRCCPGETIEDFVSTGLIRVCQPARYGGSELGWDVLCEITQLLAAACGSQAWIHRIFADHSHMVSTFPAEAQEDVWARNHNVFVSSSFDPVGRARPVDG